METASKFPKDKEKIKKRSHPAQYRIDMESRDRLERLASSRDLDKTRFLERLLLEEEERQAGMRLGRLELVLNRTEEILRQMDLFQREGHDTRKLLADLSGITDRLFTRIDHVIAIMKSQEQEARGRDGELVSLIETMLQLSSVTAARIQALSETTRNEEFQKRAQELIRQLQEP